MPSVASELPVPQPPRPDLQPNRYGTAGGDPTQPFGDLLDATANNVSRPERDDRPDPRSGPDSSAEPTNTSSQRTPRKASNQDSTQAASNTPSNADQPPPANSDQPTPTDPKAATTDANAKPADKAASAGKVADEKKDDGKLATTADAGGDATADPAAAAVAAAPAPTPIAIAAVITPPILQANAAAAATSGDAQLVSPPVTPLGDGKTKGADIAASAEAEAGAAAAADISGATPGGGAPKAAGVAAADPAVKAAALASLPQPLAPHTAALLAAQGKPDKKASAPDQVQKAAAPARSVAAAPSEPADATAPAGPQDKAVATDLRVHPATAAHPVAAHPAGETLGDTTSNAPAAPAASNAATPAINLVAAAPATPTLAPVTALRLDAPADAAVPIAGLAVEIATRARDGLKRFDIRLDPPDLGRIDVRLDVDRDGRVTSHLVVERADTLDLLRRDQPSLERALQQAGLKTDGGIDFSLRDQSFRDQAPRDNAPATTTTNLIIPDDEPAAAEAARRGYGRLIGLGGGVDIRV